MPNKILGKIMVMSIIAAGLLQFFQKVFIGDSTILINIKMFLLVLSLFAALVMVSIMTWKAKQKEKNSSE